MKKIIRNLFIVVLSLVLASPFANMSTVNADDDTVTVTVNFVYKSNNAMVTQPYVAQIIKDGEFKRDVVAPSITNYSIPVNEIVGLATGITFANNTLSFDMEAVANDISVTLYYVAGTASYTVNHYEQNLQNDEYTLVKSMELTGDIDSYTQAAADSKTGFVCKGVPEVIIAADGTTTVNIYYDRIYYTIVFDPNGGLEGPDPIYAKYGTTVDISNMPSPRRKNYDFVGWSPTINTSITVTGNAIYTANWVANDEIGDYTIIIWGKNADDDNYTYLNAAQAFGTPGEILTYAAGTYICHGAHTHSTNCYNLTCQLQEHTHTDACGLICNHVHDPYTCFGVTLNPTNGKPLASNLNNINNPQEGYVYCVHGYYYNNATRYTVYNYYFYHNGQFYYLSSDSTPHSYSSNDTAERQESYNGLTFRINHLRSSNYSGNRNNPSYLGYTVSTAPATVNSSNPSSCDHHHDDNCYTCGMEAHTHSTWNSSTSQYNSDATGKNAGTCCYTLVCGKESHTHNSSCKRMGDYAPDSSLWEYERCDEVELLADGTTVFNVYFKRKEFTFTFNDNNRTVKTITAPWGKDITDEWYPFIGSNGTDYTNHTWTVSSNTNNIYVNGNLVVFAQLMPAGNAVFNHRSSSQAFKMYYYCEVLEGTSTNSKRYNNQTVYFNPDYMFYLGANYGSATLDEDFFEIPGYTKWAHGTSNGNMYGPTSTSGLGSSPVYFYYTRNKHNIYFHSGDDLVNAERTERDIKYGASISQYGGYQAVTRPTTVEDNAIFVEWYDNPYFAGQPFNFDTTMPDKDIHLYAKWVNGIYTVTTYTNEGMTELYTYEGYPGSETNIYFGEKAHEVEHPTKEGEAFIGWFYIGEDGQEHAFSYLLPITRDYDLYPKFSANVAVTYTVHYYIEGTTTKVADDRENTVMIGSTVTERAKTGTDLNLVTDYNHYFPNLTSTSAVIITENYEIIFYYKEATSMSYTVRYVDANGVELLPSVTKTTEYSIVTEIYVPIENYTSRFYSITQELTSDATQNIITFIYDINNVDMQIKKQGWEDIDPGQVFIFHVEGVGENNSDIDLYVTIHGNGTVTLKDVPVGRYKVTEMLDWCWRYEVASTQTVSITKTLTLNFNDNIFVFNNDRTETKWLDKDTSVDNIFDGGND